MGVRVPPPALNLAFRYADHVVVMKAGAIAAEGAPRDVIGAELITDVFGLACEIVPDPVSGTPMVVARGRHHAAEAGESAGRSV